MRVRFSFSYVNRQSAPVKERLKMTNLGIPGWALKGIFGVLDFSRL